MSKKMGDFLREELEAYATPTDRTIINFVWDPDNAKTPDGFEYVAIWVEDTNRWYLSGRVPQEVLNGPFSTPMISVTDHGSMMEFLARKDVVAVRTSAAWEVVKGLHGPVEETFITDNIGRPVEVTEAKCTCGTVHDFAEDANAFEDES